MEDFVSFKIAKKLKEKGYPFNTFHHYDRDGGIIVALCDCDERCEYPMPEIHQVLKWLREEKFILIGLSPMQEYGGDEVVEWCATIYKTDNKGGLSWKEELYYQSYEAAALAGIEYVLDNLI